MGRSGLGATMHVSVHEILIFVSGQDLISEVVTGAICFAQLFGFLFWSAKISVFFLTGGRMVSWVGMDQRRNQAR